jgi:serine/threonine-protein kinase OSR1/STK39
MATNIAERVQYPLDSSSYKIVDEIGAGNSAVVYKAICIPINSTPVAIKSIDLDRSRPDLDDVRREAKTLSLLSHPNILKAHCSFTVDNRLWVVMPFMAGGSLQSIISHSFQNGLTEQSIAVILKDTLNALSYLHGQGHLHRDIKSGNILVDSNGLVKLADFGVSASIYESNNSVGTCSSYSSSSSNSSSSHIFTDFAGTPYWMAPEVIHSHNGYSFKADIWSFGITALELAHGRPPLSHLPPSKSLMLNITKRFKFSDFDKHSYKGHGGSNKFSKAFKDMVALCLNQDPTKRPSAEKLLKHSFFKNCKGSEYLVKNVLNGLPSVEKRYKEIKAITDPDSKCKDGGDDDDEESVKNVKQRRISGWNFNEDGLELVPVFPKDQSREDEVVKQVRFEEEKVIQEDAVAAASGTVMEPRSTNASDVVDHENVGGVVKNREATLATLNVLKESLEQELGQVKFLMNLIGGEEIHVADSDEKMVQEISKLRTDLENERKKNLQLEMQLENIKLHLISSAVNSPTS